MRDHWLEQQPEIARGFSRAVAVAIRILREDVAAWRRAVGVDAISDGIAQALRTKWLARVGIPWQSGMIAELARLSTLLAGQTLPAGTFANELLQGEAS
jgi:hypothetical protein